MRRSPGRFVVAIYLFVTCSSPAVGGGPLKYDATGPVTWDPQNPIQYRIDKGDLGPIPAATIQAAVKQAFKFWSNISTASIKFEFVGLLDHDVKTLADYNIATNRQTGGNVVILDSTGDIIAAIYGERNRFRILGFASPVVSRGRVIGFFSLMNGRLAASAEAFLGKLTHEFGHAVGLDHSQIHAEFANDGIASNGKYMPTMFPSATAGDTLAVPPKPDDCAWISKLYPSMTFNASYGTIKGRIVRGDNTPVLGANVIAVLQGDARASRRYQYSCVSDWLKQRNGEFVIPVKPGKYRLHLEPIAAWLTGGSSVGPHAKSPSDASFVNPIEASDPANIIEVTAGAEANAGNVVAE